MRRLPLAGGLAFAALALCTAVPASGTEPFAARPDSSPFAIRKLLRAGETAELERRLESWRAGRDERRLRDAYWTLRKLPRAESKALKAWLRSSPDSPSAHLAAALRALGQAGEARGSGFASTVTDEGWREMRAHCARALGLADALLRLDPTRVEAHWIRMEVGRKLGDRRLVRESFEAALVLDPADYEVWSERLWSASRRWGGSYREQEQLAEAAQQHAASNPRLRVLRARPYADRAMDLADADEDRAALALYDAALEVGELSWVYRRRGGVHARLGDHRLALADYDRAIAIGGPQPSTHYSRSRALFKLERHREGLAALELAVALEPGNRKYQRRLLKTRRWLAERERWENPGPIEYFAYVLYFLLEHAATGLACTLVAWALWRAWQWRRRPDARDLPLAASVSLGWHPELPAVVALLLRAVLVLTVLVHAGYFVFGWSESGWVVRCLDLPITGVALLGAVAYARGRRLGTQEVWRLWAVLFPLWKLILHAGIWGMPAAAWPAFVVLNLALAPVYASLFAYGFGSRSIWDDAPVGAGWQAPSWESPLRRSPER